MADKSDLISALEDRAPGDHPMDAAKLAEVQSSAILSAMAKHAEVRPRMVMVDLPGDGSAIYPLTGLTDWTDEFSRVEGVDYPVDDTAVESTRIDSEAWTVRRLPAGFHLVFLEDKPGTDATIRITHTALHVCDDTECTVSVRDIEAVKALAASYYCMSLAGAYALDQDATIAVDSANHSDRMEKFQKLSRYYKQVYNNHMNIKDGKARPACGTTEWDSTYPGGADRLTHPGRYR